CVPAPCHVGETRSHGQPLRCAVDLERTRRQCHGKRHAWRTQHAGRGSRTSAGGASGVPEVIRNESQHYASHWITEYDRAGTSKRVRPLLVDGLSKAWGFTRSALKPLTALRSLPVKT